MVAVEMFDLLFRYYFDFLHSIFAVELMSMEHLFAINLLDFEKKVQREEKLSLLLRRLNGFEKVNDGFVSRCRSLKLAVVRFEKRRTI